jgi:hypothetical protein
VTARLGRGGRDRVEGAAGDGEHPAAATRLGPSGAGRALRISTATLQKNLELADRVPTQAPTAPAGGVAEAGVLEAMAGPRERRAGAERRARWRASRRRGTGSAAA